MSTPTHHHDPWDLPRKLRNLHAPFGIQELDRSQKADQRFLLESSSFHDGNQLATFPRSVPLTPGSHGRVFERELSSRSIHCLGCVFIQVQLFLYWINNHVITMVDILERVQEICDKGEKNDPDVIPSCIQEIKEEIKKQEKYDAEGDFGQNLKANMETLQNPKHEHHQDLVHRLFDKFGKILTKDWKAMEKMEKRGWKRKKAKKLSNKKAKKARAKAKKLAKKKAKKTRAKDGMDENEDEEKDSEDGWSQGKLRRTYKTMPERAQWAIEQTQPAYEKHKARLESLKGGLDLLTEILESLTVEECTDFEYEEEHKCNNENTNVVEVHLPEEENGTSLEEFDTITSSLNTVHCVSPTFISASDSSKASIDAIPTLDPDKAMQAFKVPEEHNDDNCDPFANQGSHPDDGDEEEAHNRNFSNFCRSIGHSEDINGNLVQLCTKVKTCLPVKPQLHKLEKHLDPDLKCTTCDKKIDNSNATYYCRPCQRVRICDNKSCAILHHCKIWKPKAFCVCGQDAMFCCERCREKSYCCKACQIKDWSRHKQDCHLPLIDQNPAES